ncbi:MAG: efflux RND transporter periplasmic adaptor subunit [Bacteroidales bacterium]|jgi:HlyD family secretion protein|nr:efflux RND transporter periplasmic adaptor subunit [Bacteroidales bacterium]
MNRLIVLTGIVFIAVSCGGKKSKHDASGIFEATEVIISAEASGKVETFHLKEGDRLTEGQQVGYIDSVQLYLKKMQLLAAQKAVVARRPDITRQIAATKEQIDKARLEKARVENLFKDGAATQKQADDADSQLRILESALDAQTNSLSTSVNSLDEESVTYNIQIAQVNDQLAKCRIVNPVEGTVLSKYAEAKEIVVSGKPLYKIADTRNMFLRAYVVSGQLENVGAGQDATVFVALSDGSSRSYPGKVTWISDKAEFTPKTVQTRDERQNLVYAVKIEVANTDGLIKIGTYGDVDFAKR